MGKLFTLRKGAYVHGKEQQMRTGGKRGICAWMIELLLTVRTGEIKCAEQRSSIVGGKCLLIPPCNSCLNPRHSSALWHRLCLRCRFWERHQAEEACCSFQESLCFISDKSVNYSTELSMPWGPPFSDENKS